MPDRQGNVTAEELRKKLEDKKSRRRHLHKVQDRLKAAIKRIRKRIKRQQDKPSGAEKAVTWARRRIGVVESPPSSNWGTQIGKWIKYTGYSGPVFWCGCFVCYAVVKVGGASIPSRIRLGYHLYIVADARANQNGLRAVSISDAKPGDIVAFDFAHIALVVKDYDGSGYLDTIDGNTSPSTAGSQNNGGGVFPKRRAVSDVLVVARPDY